MTGAAAEALQAHLATGLTTVCRCWALTRRDGVVLGFTDHDQQLQFDGITFDPGAGMTAQTIESATGLSVDNGEALGLIDGEVLQAADIEAGRYDGAGVRLWRVNWADPAARELLFAGSIGEITREGSAFRAELRGLSEALNRPLGRVYQRPCSAVLGDAACGVDTGAPGYSIELAVAELGSDDRFIWPELPGMAPDWFDHGRLTVLSGAAEGLWSTIKSDRLTEAGREITLWQSPGAPVAPGDQVRLVAGCDKRFDTCRLKFGNALNFQGFPDLPGEDWLMSYPTSSGSNTGGSRR